jgi:hypothetical protein
MIKQSTARVPGLDFSAAQNAALCVSGAVFYRSGFNGTKAHRSKSVLTTRAILYNFLSRHAYH